MINNFECNLFVLSTFFLIICNVHAWTDFSEMISLHTENYTELNHIVAYCSKGRVMRGFKFEFPTQHTFRIAFQCVPLENEISYSEKIYNDNAIDCGSTNIFEYFHSRKIQCNNNEVLQGFGFHNYNGHCNLFYTCFKSQTFLCFNNITHHKTEPAIYSKTNNKYTKLYFPEVISAPFNSAIQGFILNNHFTYSECLLISQKNIPSSLTQSVGLDISMYFMLTKSNLLSNLDLILLLEDLYKKYKSILSFTVHYLIIQPPHSKVSLYQKESCILNKKYCLDPIDTYSLVGSALVNETIKQICIAHEINKSNDIDSLQAYFNYIFAYKEKCISKSGDLNCGLNVIEMYGIQKLNLENCFNQSFDNRLNDNMLLQREYTISKENQITKDKNGIVIVNGKSFIKEPKETNNQLIARLEKYICSNLNSLNYLCNNNNNSVHVTTIKHEEKLSSGMKWFLVFVLSSALVITVISLFKLYHSSPLKKK